MTSRPNHNVMNGICKETLLFYENIPPVKLTEAWRVKLHTEGWSLLSDYILESVKIDKHHSGVVSSTATIRVADRAGQAVCVIRGNSVGLLFGLSTNEWTEVEKLCNSGQQLFYRYFKNGLNNDFNYEQKFLYNFCATCQKNDVLFIRFRRGVNIRQQFNQDIFLDVSEVNYCDYNLLNIYVQHLGCVL